MRATRRHQSWPFRTDDEGYRVDAQLQVLEPIATRQKGRAWWRGPVSERRSGVERYLIVKVATTGT